MDNNARVCPGLNPGLEGKACGALFGTGAVRGRRSEWKQVTELIRPHYSVTVAPVQVVVAVMPSAIIKPR